MGPWVYIAQQYTLYFGLFLYMAGLFGNGMTIIIFSSDRTYRTTPSTFYFLIAALHDCMQLLVNLTSRIISIGFGIDWTRMSIIWCKARLFFAATFILIPITCQCLASIDQYLITSKHVRLRHLSSLKGTYYITLFIVIISWLHSIPIFLYQDISPITGICTPTNIILSTYIPIFTVTILCGIPVMCLVTFGILTYRNISQTIALAQQQVNRQITKMVFLQALLAILSMLPYGVWLFYLLMTYQVKKDIDRSSLEYMLASIMGLMPYCSTSGRFYVFLVASSRFRQFVKTQLCFWRSANRVTVFQIRATTVQLKEYAATRRKQPALN